MFELLIIGVLSYKLLKKLISLLTRGFEKLLDKHGIRYPKTVTVGKNGKDCIEYMLESLSPPYVLKPADSAEYWRNKFDGMKKVYFSNRKEEIEYIAKTIFASGYSARLILQERNILALALTSIKKSALSPA